MALQPSCQTVQTSNFLPAARGGRKKVQMYLFQPVFQGFFCVRRPDSVCVTQRENINNQHAHRPAADASKSSEYAAAIPLFLKPVLIQITHLLITAWVISNQKLSIFVFGSLFSSCSRYRSSKAVCVYSSLLRLPNSDLSKGE